MLNGEFLLVSDFGGFHQVMNSGHVDRHGLLGEDVLPSLNTLSKHGRTVSGRSRHQDDVNVGCRQFLKSVKTSKLTVLFYFHPFLAEGCPKGLERPFDFLGESVRHGPELDLVVRFQGLGGCSCPAPSTSNQAHLDGVAATDFSTANVGEAGHCGGSRGGFYKFASAGVVSLAHWVIRCLMGKYGRVSVLPFKVLGPSGGKIGLAGPVWSTGARAERGFR